MGRSRALRLGVFIVGTLSILAIGVFLIGERQFLFSSTYRLRASFKTVAGLDAGAGVRLGGVTQGSVRRIEMPSQPDREVTVVMVLKRATRDVIRKDSVASIQTEGLLGAKYVAISFGSPASPAVNDGDTIAGEPPLEFTDMLKKTDAILGSVQEGADHLKAITEKVDRGQGTMGALVNDKKVYQQLSATVEQAKAGATAFQEDMQALKHNWFLRGFFNNRGYPDVARLSANEIGALPASSPLKQFTYNAGKVFADVDQARLKNGSALDEAGRFLEQNPFGLAVVVARGDMKGDSEERQLLMQARAMVVRDYLVKKFRMDDTRVKTMGEAKSRQVADGGTIEVDVYQTTGVRSTNVRGSR